MNRRLTIAVLCLLTVGAIAAEFSGRTRVSVNWTHTKTGLTTVSESFGTDWPSLFTLTHTSGTNANQMNQLWHGSVAMVASGTNTVNLAGGITNAFGDVLTMAEVRVIFASATNANAGAVTMGPAAANGFVTPFGAVGDVVTIRPGGCVLMVAPGATGYAVSTNGTLQLINSGTNAATVNLYVGASDG